MIDRRRSDTPGQFPATCSRCRQYITNLQTYVFWADRVQHLQAADCQPRASA